MVVPLYNKRKFVVLPLSLDHRALASVDCLLRRCRLLLFIVGGTSVSLLSGWLGCHFFVATVFDSIFIRGWGVCVVSVRAIGISVEDFSVIQFLLLLSGFLLLFSFTGVGFLLCVCLLLLLDVGVGYEMDKVWLHQLFGGYGQREEALNAVHALDGIVIRDFKLQVNLAKYTGNNSNIVELRKTSDVPKPFPEVSLSRGIGYRSYELKKDARAVSSYVDVVAGREQSRSEILTVCAYEEGNKWLNRSAVGRLPSMRSIDSLREAFISEGVFNIQFRDMGGFFVLLTFETVEDMTAMLEGGDKCATVGTELLRIVFALSQL
ncbi:hypothetical protein RHGRI_020962 [Rhododendron griersonianum]|uniref:RNA-binding protein n=1 Tax=Rhododendron griersonianum TaxID=479676 RepID=A0AAV6JIB2_9ERIC|nr:hypothetical protein RHGRI_020962 [Rhododendron griersonianum]